MVNARGLGRLGLLAVGLGIGAVVAATAGVASADSSTDPFSWIGGIDPGDLLSAPAQTTSALDMQVSIDGFDLFPTAGNTATATSDLGDIAIAIGNGASATSLGLPMGPATSVGLFNFAFADGANSQASASLGFFDSAFANGTGSSASAGFLGFFDSASANGPGSAASADSGILDAATALGPGSLAAAANGSLDTAAALGTNTSAIAVTGNGNFASVLGDNGLAEAGGTSPGVPGSFDLASVLGTGSTADAGANLTTAGNFDLAAAFGDMLNATGATGGNFLADILPML